MSFCHCCRNIVDRECIVQRGRRPVAWPAQPRPVLHPLRAVVGTPPAPRFEAVALDGQTDVLLGDDQAETMVLQAISFGVARISRYRCEPCAVRWHRRPGCKAPEQASVLALRRRARPITVDQHQAARRLRPFARRRLITCGPPWWPYASGNRGCACASIRWVEMFFSWLESNCSKCGRAGFWV